MPEIRPEVDSILLRIPAGDHLRGETATSLINFDLSKHGPLYQPQACQLTVPFAPPELNCPVKPVLDWYRMLST